MLARVLGRLLSVLVSLTSAIATGPAGTAPDWTVDLTHGQAVGVAFTGGALRLTEPTGMLLTPAYPAPQPVGLVTTRLDATTGPGAEVRVDVRGQLADGRWTEWLANQPGGPGTAIRPSVRLQLRVVLTGGVPAGRAGAETELRGLSVHTEPATGPRTEGDGGPVGYSVFATREGLVNGRTANGHRIARDDYFVALPSKRALSGRDSGEYSVKVCATEGFCAWAPVWDVGPWNIDDDYWNAERERFKDLPRGLPQAQAAFEDDHNDGEDGGGREVLNPAGIDLSDALYAALKLRGTVKVQVTYLWTGGPLSTVDAKGTAPTTDLAALNTPPTETPLPIGATGGTPAPIGTPAPAATGQPALPAASGPPNASSPPGAPSSSDAPSTSGASDRPNASAKPSASARPGKPHHRSGDDDDMFGGALDDPLANDDDGDPDEDRDGGEGHSRDGDGDGKDRKDDGQNETTARHAVVRRAPAPDAEPVGAAADRAGVLVECATPNNWVRIGPDQYLPANAVRISAEADLRPC